MPEWRRLLYVGVIFLQQKAFVFLPLILRRSVHLCCRNVREHGEWFCIKLQIQLQSLRERTPSLFAISTLWLLTEFSFLFPLLRIRILLIELFMHGLAIAHSVKAPRWGDWVFFLSPVLIPHSSQPIPNQFFLFITKHFIYVSCNAMQGTWRPAICVGKYYFFSIKVETGNFVVE